MDKNLKNILIAGAIIVGIFFLMGHMRKVKRRPVKKEEEETK